MEAEDDDEFGELYFDVLQPFSSLPDGMPGACSTSSANIVKIPADDGGMLEKEKDVVGTVKLEIYLGSRRVLENSFVFALGGQVGQGHNDSGINQAENLVTGGGINEMTSVHPSVDHSKCDPSEKMVEGDDVGHELNSYPELVNDVGDSNSDPELDRKASGSPEGHGTDIISLDNTPLCNDTVKGNENLMVMDAPSNVEMQEICKGEPSEDGQLSEYAEPLDYNEDMVIMSTTLNSAEARNGCNNLQYPHLYKSPLQNARNVGATTFGEAIMSWSQATTSKTYGYQAQARPPPRPTVNRYPYLSSSLFDLDLDSLEHRPWRYPTVDLSQYFNYGLDETSWKSYCEEIKTMRRYHAGKQIQVENGLRHRYPSAKTTPQLPQDSTATIQREQTKCYRPQELERSGEGSFKSLQDEQQIRPQANASRCDNQEHNPKRVKMVEESSRDSSSNISDNEWMCRNVGVDSWFHPISKHQETDRKGSRKGRSKLERWTRHDRDNDDENTSTSSLSSPPTFSNAGVAVQTEDS